MSLAALRPVRTIGHRQKPCRPHRPEWMDRAACAEYPQFTEWETADQLSVCLGKGGCPVRAECLAYALEQLTITSHTHTVVYGGVDPRTLVRLQRERKRAKS